MNKLRVLLFFICFPLLLCSQNKETDEVNQFLNEWHNDAAKADMKAYFDKIDLEKGVFIGTDATEIWAWKEFYEWSKPYFDKGKAWDFSSTQRNIYFNENITMAWFDELLSFSSGILRGSGILERKESGWKIMHYVLSLPVPNDDFSAVMKVINKKIQNDVTVFSKLSPSELLNPLFGPKQIINENVAIWQPNYSEKSIFPLSEDGLCYTSLDTIIYFSTQHESKALAVFGTIGYWDGEPDYCRACRPLLSIAVFSTNEDSTWILQRFKKDFVFHGSWGEVGKTEVVAVGKDKFALSLYSGGFAQGFTYFRVDYYDMWNFGWIFGSIVEESNEGYYDKTDPQAFSYTSNIDFIAGGENEYYTIVVNTSGTKPFEGNENEIVPANSVIYYMFSTNTRTFEKKCP